MFTKTSLIAFIFLILSCSKSSDNTPVTPPVVLNTIDVVVSDMQGTHESAPIGVPPAYTWQAGPRIGLGNNPNTFRAMQPWAQIFETAPGNTSTNTRIEVQKIKAYYLNNKSNKWLLWTGAIKPSAVNTSQDLTTKITKPSDVRDISGGGISVGLEKGFNIFLFAPSRVSITPADIGGVFVTVQARLILADASKPDDRDAAPVMLSAAGDYWLNLTAPGDDFTTHGDIAIGKFKRLSRDWKTFNMHTLTADQIRANPPPLE